MHPARGNTKNAQGSTKNRTAGVPVRITTGRGTERVENGTTQRKQDGENPTP